MTTTERPSTPPDETELAGWTPPQVDGVIAAIWGDIYQATDRRERAQRYITDLLKRQAAGRSWSTYEMDRLPLYEKDKADAETVLDELYAEKGTYDSEYQSRPWPRYFHVDNNGGHVHTSMSCSTCYPTTRYVWLTGISGQDEDACVALVGETACTVCMPSAPVKPGYGDGTSGWARRTAEQQAERDREKAVKQAAKDAKAITDVDGSVLRVDGWVIKTLVAAKQNLTDAVERATYEGSSASYRSDKIAERDQLAAAIAHKTGEPVDKVIADAEKRAQQRAKRYR